MKFNFLILDEAGNLRSGYRSALFLFLYILSVLLLDLPVKATLAAAGLSAKSGTNLYFAINAVLSLIPAIFVGWICGKLLERLPFRALGAAFTRGWLKHWVLGLAFGAATLCLAVVPAIIFGGLRFEFNDAPAHAILRSMAISFGVFAAASAFEEALFRGYILQTFTRAGLAWVAIAVTSLFFGLVHTGNPASNEISTLNTILAGVWFSVAYLKTRDLWFVWGLHLMWNWMQGSFFGIEVSGMTELTTAPLFREIDSGPSWLTGQSYGIEGGVVCTFGLIVSIAAIYLVPFLKPDDELLVLTSRKATANAD